MISARARPHAAARASTAAAASARPVTARRTLRATPAATNAQAQAPPAPPAPVLADISSATVASGTTLVRARSGEDLRREIEYGLKRGSTDNAYLLEGDAEVRACAHLAPPRGATREPEAALWRRSGTPRGKESTHTYAGALKVPSPPRRAQAPAAPRTPRCSSVAR